jgi:hypothetical protein
LVIKGPPRWRGELAKVRGRGGAAVRQLQDRHELRHLEESEHQRSAHQLLQRTATVLLLLLLVLLVRIIATATAAALVCQQLALQRRSGTHAGGAEAVAALKSGAVVGREQLIRQRLRRSARVSGRVCVPVITPTHVHARTTRTVLSLAKGSPNKRLSCTAGPVGAASSAVSGSRAKRHRQVPSSVMRNPHAWSCSRAATPARSRESRMKPTAAPRFMTPKSVITHVNSSLRTQACRAASEHCHAPAAAQAVERTAAS